MAPCDTRKERKENLFNLATLACFAVKIFSCMVENSAFPFYKTGLTQLAGSCTAAAAAQLWRNRFNCVSPIKPQFVTARGIA